MICALTLLPNVSSSAGLDDVRSVPTAVPEASTTVSPGLLLILGVGGVLTARNKRIKA